MYMVGALRLELSLRRFTVETRSYLSLHPKILAELTGLEPAFATPDTAMTSVASPGYSSMADDEGPAP